MTTATSNSTSSTQSTTFVLLSSRAKDFSEIPENEECPLNRPTLTREQLARHGQGAQRTVHPVFQTRHRQGFIHLPSLAVDPAFASRLPLATSNSQPHVLCERPDPTPSLPMPPPQARHANDIVPPEQSPDSPRCASLPDPCFATRLDNTPDEISSPLRTPSTPPTYPSAHMPSCIELSDIDDFFYTSDKLERWLTFASKALQSAHQHEGLACDASYVYTSLGEQCT
ncbi:hypothetical protein PENSPDRAFT_647425 [Peniophora sp. CONT]|nr:hypothetical protein PENSPDRAFT_647425 [Peniophora sp. CONT]